MPRRARRPALPLAALLLTACTEWEVERETRIAAGDAVVWEILSDLERYPEWNRYSRRADGELRVGANVRIEAHLGEEVRRVDNRVTVVEARRTLCWQSENWYDFLVRGIRCRHLEPVERGETRFRHHEVMRGPLAWLVERIYRPRIEEGLATVNASLKRAAEARQRQSGNRAGG